MRRVILAVTGTIAGLVALLSFRSHVPSAPVAAVVAAVVLLLLGGWLGFLLVLLPWLSCPTSTRVHLNWTALHSFPVRTLRQA